MEALTLDLNESSQICEQSFLVRSKPMRLRTWLQKWKRDSWTRLLFGRILKPSHGKSFAEKWTSSVEASLVNPSLLPDVEKEMKTLDTYSLTSKEELEYVDLPLFSSRTSKGSLIQKSETDGTTEKEPQFCYMSFESWNDWVMKQRRESLRRVNAAHHIKEKEFSSWPTPTVLQTAQSPSTLFNKAGEIWKGEGMAYRKSGAHAQKSLSMMVKYGPPQEEKNKKNGNQAELCVKNWGTICTSDTRARTPKQAEKRIQDQKQLSPLEQAFIEKPWTKSHHLNPRWVETLMGVPIGWTMVTCVNPYVIEPTNCDSLVTGSCHQPPKPPLESYGHAWATPQARDHNGPQGRYYKHGTMDLPAQVYEASNWATPRVGMAAGSGGWGDPNKKEYSFRLENQVKEINEET